MIARSSYKTASKLRNHLSQRPYTGREVFERLAETFQALGDTSRVRIVWSLSHGEISVGALAETLAMSQPAVSHHLRTLRNLHLVNARKQGREVFYRLDDEHIDRLLKEGLEHVKDFMRST